MNIFPEYHKYDALGLIEIIKSGEITYKEVCQEAIQRAKLLNPSLNAIIHPLYEQLEGILKKVSESGSFYGVPFLLKDLQHALQGVPLSSGSKAMYNFVPPKDNELVRRWKDTGLITLGKTNTPELGLMATTEPELFGPARNPWNLEHSPGGSSGGSAAAVSARIVPVASAGDGGGSIRIPASCCGVFGLKPSRGRMPTGPDFGEIWEGAVTDHILSISVRDSAALLDATHGPDQGAPYLISKPKKSFLQEASQDPQTLKIGYSLDHPLKEEVHPECKHAVTQTASLLSELGHRVEEVPLPYDGELVAECYTQMYFAQTAAILELMGQLRGSVIKRKEVELSTWTLASQGKIKKAKDYCLSLIRWNDISRAMGRYHQKQDLLLTPVLATPPPLIGEMQLNGLERFGLNLINTLHLERLLSIFGTVEEKVLTNLVKTPFTQVANISGQPAMSVPLYWTDQGLPCGVQFIAPLGDEGTLFNLAGQLERTKPWFDKAPPYPEANKQNPRATFCSY